jgi:protein-L-isoaspartate(D-aspartate) O-methyltransferase
MVAEQLRARGIQDERVLKAMGRIPREDFVPEELHRQAYDDSPLPIGCGQTISQPYIVAVMTELLGLSGTEKVLEVGTGSGYQTAVLAALGREVCSVEIEEEMSRRARERLERLGFGNVRLRAGDGYYGWPEEAPFGAVLLTAAPHDVPAPLLEQLAEGARLVAPLGRQEQDLVVITRFAGGFQTEWVLAVRFVPMRGEAERR